MKIFDGVLKTEIEKPLTLGRNLAEVQSCLKMASQ